MGHDLTTASDATEFLEIEVVWMDTPHWLSKIIVCRVLSSWGQSLRCVETFVLQMAWHCNFDKAGVFFSYY